MVCLSEKFIGRAIPKVSSKKEPHLRTLISHEKYIWKVSQIECLSMQETMLQMQRSLFIIRGYILFNDRYIF